MEKCMRKRVFVEKENMEKYETKYFRRECVRINPADPLTP